MSRRVQVNKRIIAAIRIQIQAVKPKISVPKTIQPIVNANGTMQLAAASAPSISVAVEGGLLRNLAYSVVGNQGGSSYNGSNKEGSKAGKEGSRRSVKGTSYDINKLYKTQPSSYTDKGVVENMMDSIQKNGPEAVPPIPVRVHQGQALVVDGHHRLAAFSELGYDRVPIKYIHGNQIGNYGRTLADLLSGMYK